MTQQSFSQWILYAGHWRLNYYSLLKSVCSQLMVPKELVIRLLGGNQAKPLKSWAALIKDTNRGMDDDQLD